MFEKNFDKPKEITISAKELDEIPCEYCNEIIFEPCIIAKRIPADINPNGYVDIHFISVLRCSACKKVSSIALEGVLKPIKKND